MTVLMMVVIYRTNEGRNEGEGLRVPAPGCGTSCHMIMVTVAEMPPGML